jgi:hypothetical protein
MTNIKPINNPTMTNIKPMSIAETILNDSQWPDNSVCSIICGAHQSYLFVEGADIVDQWDDNDDKHYGYSYNDGSVLVIRPFTQPYKDSCKAMTLQAYRQAFNKD